MTKTESVSTSAPPVIIDVGQIDFGQLKRTGLHRALTCVSCHRPTEHALINGAFCVSCWSNQERARQ